jgi:hypothetical protein
MDWRRWNVHVYAMEGFEVSVDRTLLLSFLKEFEFHFVSANSVNSCIQSNSLPWHLPCILAMDWRRWNVHVYAMEGFEVSVDRTLNNKNFWRWTISVPVHRAAESVESP